MENYKVAKGVNRKADERNSLFSKEILGMALILFSVLSLLCLLIGDVVYPVGAIVRGFFLGVFGYYSFVFLILTILLGVKFVITKPILSKQGKRAIFVINVAIFGIFVIVHTVVCLKQDLPLKETLLTAYGNGAFDLTNSTAGGALFSLIVYPIMTYAGRIVTFVIFGVIIAICIWYFVNKFRNAGEKQPKQKKQQKRVESSSVQLPLQTDNSSAQEYAKNNFGKAESSDTQVQPTSGLKYNGLFIMGDDSFGGSQQKSRKSRNPESQKKPEIDYAFGSGTSGSFFAQTTQRSRPYTETFVQDLDEKIKYVTTPQAPNLTNIGQSPIDAKNPGAGSSIEHTSESVSYSGGSDTKDVYKTDRTRRVETIDSFKRAQESSVSGGYEVKNGFGGRRDTLGSISDGAKSDAFGSVFDRNPPSENFGVQPVRSRDIFADNSTSVDRSKDVSQTPTRTSGFTEQNAGDVSQKVYNPLKNDRVDNVPRDAFSRVERVSRIDRVETTDKVSPVATEDSVEVTDIKKDETPLEKSNISRDSFSRRSERRVLDSEKIVQTTIEEVEKTQPRQSEATIPENSLPTVNRAKEVKQEENTPNPIDNMPVNYRYKAPPISLLNDIVKDEEAMQRDRQKQMERAQTIVDTLSFRNINATVEDIIYGPSVTRFVISVPQGVQMSAIKGAQQELQVWLEASSEIRMLIPIPGTSKIGIEVPNAKTSAVGLKDILSSKQYKNIKQESITFALGKDIVGNPVFLDVMEMPHLIVAGATGTGKSVCLNSMLISLLYRYSPEDLRLIIVDPKMVEFEMYKGLPHLMFNDIIGINDGRALAMLEWATIEMDRRYMLFKDVGARKLAEYNGKVGNGVDKKLPYIIILIDEFAELMMTAQEKKKVENKVGRLAQKARAAGISLIFATQRPSADVIDGSIKTNFTSRICFKTSSGVDSNVVIGQSGAEALLGKGDVFYKMTSMPNVERAQGALITDEEVLKVTDYIREHNRAYYDEKALALINQSVEEKEQENAPTPKASDKNSDPNAVEEVYLRALRLVILTRNVSKTSLQTKLGVGYPKAAKIIDWMEEEGFVSPVIDNKQRAIYITKETYIERFGEFDDDFRKRS